MKQHHVFKFMILLILGLVFHSTSIAQKVTQEKLLGCWKIKSIEFLQPMEDSLDLINSFKGITICFEKNGKFVTKLKTENSTQIIGTGTFSIDSDGKTFTQKRDTNEDEGIDPPAEISMINDHEVSFKIEDLILHYERLSIK